MTYRSLTVIGVTLAVASATPAVGSRPPVTSVQAASSQAGLIVVAWRRGGALRYVVRDRDGRWGGSRTLSSRVGFVGGEPALVSGQRWVGLAYVARGVGLRLARWGGRTAPAIDGPGGPARVFGVGLAASAGEAVALAAVRGAAVDAVVRDRRNRWSAPVRLFPDDVNMALASNGSGRFLAAASTSGTGGDTVLASIRSAGGGFGAPSGAFSTPFGTGVTSIAPAVRRTGGAVLVVATRTGGGPGTLVAVRASRPGSWSSPITIARNPLPGRQAAAVAVRPTGNVVAVWREVRDGRLRLLASQERNAGGAAWRPPMALTPPVSRLGSPAIGVAPDGRTYVAYSLRGAIHVRSLGPQSSATRWTPPRRVSPPRCRCISPNVVFGRSGRPVIVFVGGGKIMATAAR